jgi:hypothetical protein
MKFESKFKKREEDFIPLNTRLNEMLKEPQFQVIEKHSIEQDIEYLIRKIEKIDLYCNVKWEFSVIKNYGNVSMVQ